MWPYVAIFYRYHGLAVRCVPWVDCDVERTVASGLIEMLPALFSSMTYMYILKMNGTHEMVIG